MAESNQVSENLIVNTIPTQFSAAPFSAKQMECGSSLGSRHIEQPTTFRQPTIDPTKPSTPEKCEQPRPMYGMKAGGGIMRARKNRMRCKLPFYHKNVPTTPSEVKFSITDYLSEISYAAKIMIPLDKAETIVSLLDKATDDFSSVLNFYHEHGAFLYYAFTYFLVENKNETFRINFKSKILCDQITRLIAGSLLVYPPDMREVADRIDEGRDKNIDQHHGK